jgi:alkanesulfonate monooxygenase SsuD/methylene tetrahydromethanopterin reductase-like flavin-dependent oxidoreductase (luciferase family)
MDLTVVAYATLALSLFVSAVKMGGWILNADPRAIINSGRWALVALAALALGLLAWLQAGGSPPGQELSARSADLVFSVVNGDPASAKAAYDALKQRVVKHGRAPADVPILPGVMPIIGESDQQLKDQLARLQSWLTSTNAMALVSQRLGHDISGYPLDGPVPDFPAKTERGQAFSKTLLEMARRENMTLRDLYNIPPPRAAIG